ncbi:MAG TPA: cupin domain-containing protein [Burkholderiales bacterium]|nr:cupin domain-containing protein [Burkholderiales bacterium]
MKLVQVAPESEFEVIAGTKRSQAAVMVVAAGSSEGGRSNKHETADQWLYVMSGNGSAIVNGKEVTLEAGTLLLIEAGETHEIRASGEVPLSTLNFYAPPQY